MFISLPISFTIIFAFIASISSASSISTTATSNSTCFQSITSIFDPKSLTNATEMLEICSMPFTSNDIYSGVMNTLYGIQQRMSNSKCPGSVDLSTLSGNGTTSLFPEEINAFNTTSLANYSPLANATMFAMKDITKSMFDDATNCQLNMTKIMILVSSNMKLLTNRLMCGQLQRDILFNHEAEPSTSFSSPYYRHNSFTTTQTYFPRGSLKDMGRSLTKITSDNSPTTSDDDLGQVIIN